MQGWPGDEVCIRDGAVARDLAARIGGAKAAMRDDQPCGAGHVARVCALPGATRTVPCRICKRGSPAYVAAESH